MNRPAHAPRPAPTTFRERLWEYLGQPDEETPERRRLLYAIVALRVGLGLLFFLRGLEGVFASSAASFAARLGDPARWGLSGLATDTVLFILGCTEIGIGALLIAGAFTRVSATTGTILAALYFAFGRFAPTARCPYPGGCTGSFFDNVVERTSLLFVIGGLLVLVFCGSPFLGADRALDKLEEEERDRAPRACRAARGRRRSPSAPVGSSPRSTCSPTAPAWGWTRTSRARPRRRTPSSRRGSSWPSCSSSATVGESSSASASPTSC